MGSDRLFYASLTAANLTTIYGIGNKATIGIYFAMICMLIWISTVALFVRLVREKMRENKASRVSGLQPK